MYVTPPDTDVYAIPKVLAPMPEKVKLKVLLLSLMKMCLFSSGETEKGAGRRKVFCAVVAWNAIDSNTL